MTIGYNAAINAYGNAARMIKQAQEDGSTSSGTSGTSGAAGSGFSNAISNALSSSVSSLRSAESVSAKALVKQADITDVVTAISNAEVTLKTVMAVRDRLVAAHQEIMRMPI